MSLRVVQWNTGIVGTAGVRAIAEHPRLELVGCYAWSEDKVGHDAGELAGTVKLGVEATRDVDALLALSPDCVLYTPLFPDVDHLVAEREASTAREEAAHLERARLARK